MNILTGIREAGRALSGHKLRTALTLLGMVIGVAAVVVVVALGQALQKRITTDLSSFGANLMWVSPGARANNGVRVRAQTLTRADGDAIAELPGVMAVAAVNLATVQASYGNANWQSQVQGVTPAYIRLQSRAVVAGRGITDADVRGATRVAVLGPTVVDELFGDEDPLGRTMRMKGVPFEVIGVLDRKGKAFGGNDQDDTVLVPLETVPRALGLSLPPGAVSYLMLGVAEGAVSGDVAFEVADLLRQRHRVQPGQADDFTVGDMTSLIATMAGITGAITLALGGIGAVSLLVGGIGIMNIMLVTVTERTREIGIRMAIGARRRDIMSQFLFEASAICLLGGALGLALGATGAWAAARAMNLPAAVSPQIMLMAFGVSAAIGLIFGLYPARKASKLRPVEALRAE